MTKATEAPNVYRLIGPSADNGDGDLLSDQSAKDSRLRLQALIAEWLRMENLVVLAGAGTSVSSGGKNMNGLEEEVLATVKALKEIPAEVGKILDGRLAELSSPSGTSSIGFEEWLSFLANAHHIGLSIGSPFSDVIWKTGTPEKKHVSWLVENIGKSIFAECALTLPEAGGSAAGIAPHFAFLSKLVARDSNLGRAHLFTLNYDTLFEQALELLGIQYFDGFTGRADARFDPSVYGLDIYYPGEIAEGRVRRFDKFLHLYKLHGSIHWEVHGAELRARHPDLRDFSDYRNLSPSDKAGKFEPLMKALRPAGILPTANKFTQTLSMPFAHLFRSFQIRLGAPQTYLLVLGYGFGDEHVNHIIETALMNPSLVMLVVEPNPKAPTIERIRSYKDLGKRAFVLTQTEDSFDATGYKLAGFDDFSRSIMPDVQWLEDFLRLRRFEKQIAAGQKQDDLAGDAGL